MKKKSGCYYRRILRAEGYVCHNTKKPLIERVTAGVNFNYRRLFGEEEDYKNYHKTQAGYAA
jgi:hypothetical protein